MCVSVCVYVCVRLDLWEEGGRRVYVVCGSILCVYANVYVWIYIYIYMYVCVNCMYILSMCVCLYMCVVAPACMHV